MYCRVSGREQVEEGNSLVTQERICKEIIFNRDCILVESFIEKGKTAKHTDRPELKRLLKYCSDRKNGISAVFVYKIDRIARKKYDYDGLKILLKRYDVEIISCTEKFDNSPAGRFMESVIADVAQFDNDMRAERSVGGMKQATIEGRYVWMAPIGYDNIRINGKGSICQNDMAPIVRKAFEAIAQNTLAIDEVRKQMVKEGLVNKKGKLLNRGYFYRLLKNPVYAGWIIKFGERHKGLFDPIISEELFDQVQRVLKHRKRRNVQYLMENPDFPLRRFVYHPTGARLTGSWSRGNTKRYAYYRYKLCGFEFKKGLLEERYSSYISEFKLHEEHYKRFKELITENLIKATKDRQQVALRLKKQITDLKEKQNSLIQKNLSGVISDTILREQLESIEESLLNKHADLAKMPDQEMNIEKALGFASIYLKNPDEVWRKAKLPAKLQLQWFQFPKGITFDGEKFGTTEMRNIFTAKDFFLTHLSPKADLMHLSSNTPIIPNSKKIKEFSELIGQEIIELGSIIENLDKEVPPEEDGVHTNLSSLMQEL